MPAGGFFNGLLKAAESGKRAKLGGTVSHGHSRVAGSRARQVDQIVIFSGHGKHLLSGFGNIYIITQMPCLQQKCANMAFSLIQIV